MYWVHLSTFKVKLTLFTTGVHMYHFTDEWLPLRLGFKWLIGLFGLSLPRLCYFIVTFVFFFPSCKLLTVTQHNPLILPVFNFLLPVAHRWATLLSGETYCTDFHKANEGPKLETQMSFLSKITYIKPSALMHFHLSLLQYYNLHYT